MILYHKLIIVIVVEIMAIDGFMLSLELLLHISFNTLCHYPIFLTNFTDPVTCLLARFIGTQLGFIMGCLFGLS